MVGRSGIIKRLATASRVRTVRRGRLPPSAAVEAPAASTAMKATA